MLVRLGMRSGEVAKLRLEDIDWRAGEIIVRGKANSIERIPLPPDVGRAVAQYLQRGRPVSAQGRTVFVRIKPPHRHLSSCGVSNVVADAAKRAGLGRIDAHRLRHTVFGDIDIQHPAQPLSAQQSPNLKKKIDDAKRRHDMPLDSNLGNPNREERAADGHLDMPEEDDQ